MSRAPKALRYPLEGFGEEEHGAPVLALVIDMAEDKDRWSVADFPRVNVRGRWTVWQSRGNAGHSRIRGLDTRHPLQGFEAATYFEARPEPDRWTYLRLECRPFAGVMDSAECQRCAGAFRALERKLHAADSAEGAIEPTPHGAGRWYGRLAAASGAVLVVADAHGSNLLRTLRSEYDENRFHQVDVHALQNVIGTAVQAFRYEHAQKEAASDA